MNKYNLALIQYKIANLLTKIFFIWLLTQTYQHVMRLSFNFFLQNLMTHLTRTTKASSHNLCPMFAIITINLESIRHNFYLRLQATISNVHSTSDCMHKGVKEIQHLINLYSLE